MSKTQAQLDQIAEWVMRHHDHPTCKASPAARVWHDQIVALEIDRANYPLTPHQLETAKSSMVDVFTPTGRAVVIDQGGPAFCLVSGRGWYRKRIATRLLRASAVLQRIAQEAVYGAK